MEKLSRLKILGIIILLGGVLLLSACANDNNTGNSAEDGEVAGANQDMIYGYIVEINEQARTVLVDEFDLVQESDNEGGGDLGLDREDFVNGYYINNAGGVTRLYPLSANVVYRLSDLDYNTSDYYRQRWNGDGSGAGTDRLNNSLNDNSINNNNMFGNDNYTPPGNNPDTVNSFGRNNSLRDNYNVTGSDLTNYNIDDLRQRLGEYDNIPFILTIENGTVVRIEELDFIYR